MKKEYFLAIYLKDLFFSDKNELLSNIKNEFPEFDGTNIALPIPDDVDRDIPRVILKSEDESMECNISFTRIIFRWPVEENKNAIDVVDYFLSGLNNIFKDKYLTSRLGFATIISEEFTDQDLPKILAAETSSLIEYSVAVVYEDKLNNDQISITKRFDYLLGRNAKDNKTLDSRSDIGTDIKVSIDKKIGELSVIIGELITLGKESVITEVRNGKSPS